MKLAIVSVREFFETLREMSPNEPKWRRVEQSLKAHEELDSAFREAMMDIQKWKYYFQHELDLLDGFGEHADLIAGMETIIREGQEILRSSSDEHDKKIVRGAIEKFATMAQQYKWHQWVEELLAEE